MDGFDAVAGAFKQLIGQSTLFEDAPDASQPRALLDAPAAEVGQYHELHPLQQMSFAAQQQLQQQQQFQQQQQQQFQQQQVVQGFPIEYQMQYQLQRQQEKLLHDQKVAEAQAALKAATLKLQAHEAMMAERQAAQAAQTPAPGSSSSHEQQAEPVKGAGVIPDATQWKNVSEAVAFMNALNKAASKTYKELLPLKANLSFSGTRTFNELEE